jgi:hypothetical protein
MCLPLLLSLFLLVLWLFGFPYRRVQTVLFDTTYSCIALPLSHFFQTYCANVGTCLAAQALCIAQLYLLIRSIL